MLKYTIPLEFSSVQCCSVQFIVKRTLNTYKDFKWESVNVIFRTLRNNDIKTWEVYFAKELPNLRKLDIRGNKDLHLPRDVLFNTSLDTINGPTMTSFGPCDLQRSNQSWDLVETKSFCQRNFINESKFTCTKNNMSCEVRFSVNEEKWPYCHVKALSLVPVEYIFGIFAIFSNIFVLLITLSSRKLRAKVSFFLIANIAMADLLIGAYSVSVAAGHNYKTNSNIRKARAWRLTSCPYIRSVLIVGEFVGVTSSLALSIERYLAVVHWKKPWLRLSLNKASYIIVLCWIIAIGECLILELYTLVTLQIATCVSWSVISITQERPLGDNFLQEHWCSFTCLLLHSTQKSSTFCKLKEHLRGLKENIKWFVELVQFCLPTGSFLWALTY